MEIGRLGGAAMFSFGGQRKYLNPVERKAFHRSLSACEDLGQKTFCLTLYYTGCRISEALELTSERVDFGEKAIVLRTLKRRDPHHFRIVPVPENLLRMLDDLAITRPSFSAPLWGFSRPTGYRLVTRYMRKAGLFGPKTSPKGLRHGFAVACISSGVPITTLQRWMGHARLETTAIYLQLTGEEDRKQAMKLWKGDG